MELDTIEEFTFVGSNGSKSVKTNCDYSNVNRTSIDYSVASRIGAGPVVKTVKIKSKDERRPVVECKVKIHGTKKSIKVNLADWDDKPYDAVLGDNLLELIESHDEPIEEEKPLVLKCDRPFCGYVVPEEKRQEFAEMDLCPRCQNGFLEPAGFNTY